MIKRLSAAAAILLLCLGCALAENALECPFPADTPAAGVAAAAADALGLPLHLTEEADTVKAVNTMLGGPGTLLCADQTALILSLQGYTDRDLRTDMQAVYKIASCPLFLVMDWTVAEEMGISDAGGLIAYMEENEYELLLARHIDADIIDRAVTLLSDELPLLTDYYSEEEIPAALESGEVHAAVISGTDLEKNGEGLLVLCSLGAQRTALRPDLPCAAELGLPVCREISVYLFTSAQTGRDAVEAAVSACGVLETEGLAVPGFDLTPLSGDALENEIREIFADYKKYMTAEGLFFYEE